MFSRFEKLTQKFTDTLQHVILNEVGNPILERYPSLTPAIIGGGFQIVKRSYPPGTTYEPLPYAIHFRYGIGLAPVFDMEFGFPFNLYDDGSSYEKISQALKYVVEEAERHAKGKKYQCYKF